MLSPDLGNAARPEGLEIDVSAMDVDSDESVNTAISRILETAGHIDVLVNNAGIEVSGSIEELPMEQELKPITFRVVIGVPGREGASD